MPSDREPLPQGDTPFRRPARAIFAGFRPRNGSVFLPVKNGNIDVLKDVIMKSGNFSNSQDAADAARRTLCAFFAQTLRQGSFRTRIRLHQPLGAAWFYEHSNNTWHKQDVTLEDPALVEAVTDELALLASKPHGDIVHVAQHTASDWKETDIQFERDALERHLDHRLEGYLAGLLFGDRHDSKQDVRRQMHNGPRH